MRKQTADTRYFPMKMWLNAQGITYRDLALQMDQSVGTICKKVNRQMRWQETDLVWLFENYGLSSDFVIGNTKEHCEEVA